MGKLDFLFRGKVSEMDTEERDRWLAQKQAEADDPNTDDDEVNEAPVTVINGEDE